VIAQLSCLRPQKPTKYAVFVVGKLPQLTDTVCLPNKQAVFQISSIFSIFLTIRTREAVIYLMAQSCLHVVINFPRPPKPDQNMLAITEFRKIPRKRRTYAEMGKFHGSAQNSA